MKLLSRSGRTPLPTLCSTASLLRENNLRLQANPISSIEQVTVDCSGEVMSRKSATRALCHRQATRAIMAVGLYMALLSLPSAVSAQPGQSVGGECRACAPYPGGTGGSPPTTTWQNNAQCVVEAQKLQRDHCKNIHDWWSDHCAGDAQKAGRDFDDDQKTRRKYEDLKNAPECQNMTLPGLSNACDSPA